MEDVMYDPPAYVWALTIGGPTAIAAATCIALYGCAVRTGLGRRRAALLAGAVAVVLGGWFTATAAIAGHGWYDTRSSQVPWLPIAAAGSLGVLLALSRIRVAARALTAPGMASRLVLPQTFRVTGVFFLLYLVFGHLPALFALQAGLGDIAADVPLMIALHITCLVALARTPRPAPPAAAARSFPAPRRALLLAAAIRDIAGRHGVGTAATASR
jgi:hypothetical protein